ncbi:MAG TPA: thioredoxin domain-containing protein [Gemmatimonadaceae bacterium]|nr:thioredoxin domain-containing protein [Gemmatimonadaceae bacterium]
MTLRPALPVLAVLLAPLLAPLLACSADTQPPRRPGVSLRDSLRVRREAAIATRPDTFGTRVDSMRILHPPAGADAPVPWVIVISEFQCAACRHLALDVLPSIRRDIAEGGVAHLAFVNAPRDEHFNARFAAHAALCAASAGRFWEMHDSLFATLPRWDRMPDPQRWMDSLAVAAGVPFDVQDACTTRQRLLRVLEGDMRRSEQAGVTDVPAVFVGDRRLASSELTVRGIRRAIAQATAR